MTSRFRYRGLLPAINLRRVDLLDNGLNLKGTKAVRRCSNLDNADLFMAIYRVLFALAVALTPVVAAVAGPDGWHRYAIPETGAAVDIPNAIFTEDAGRPEKGYGRRFLTPDGRANLTVQSVPNDAGESPAAFLASKNLPSNILYRRITPRFFVVSGFRKENIWYNRCNFVGRYVSCVLINYPAAEKREWDSVVTRISNTLAAR